MTRRTLEEYAAAIRKRYQPASRQQKGRMLDEFCRTTGFHRKAAIRLLNRSPASRRKKPGRPRRYDASLVPALVTIWEICDRPCSKLLAAALPAMTAALERHGEMRFDASSREKLRSLSSATIDRLLRHTRARFGRQPHRTGSPTRLIQKQVPLRTFGEWRDVAPGSLQGDLVLHCGESTTGFYLSTLTAVDVATSWTELEVIWGIGHYRVSAAVHLIRTRLPFPLRQWHVDNGSEFLNRRLVAWCAREGVRMTRGRAYRKNDQAYVEQRNWLAVRRLVGYELYDSRPAYLLLQKLYARYRLQLNFFRPVRKLLQKRRSGSRIFKRYDKPRTPYQRLLESRVLSDAQRRDLEEQFQSISPVKLSREIEHILNRLSKLPRKPRRRRGIPKPVTSPVRHQSELR